MEIQLRAVERAVTLVDLVSAAQLLDGLAQGIRGRLPVLQLTDVVLGHGRKLDVVLKAEQGIHLVDELYHTLYLVLHLLRRHEDMRVVLCKAAHAHQAMQRTGQLVPVHKAQLTHTQGQVPVAVGLRFVYQHAARAVHGLNGKVLAVDERGVHIILVMVPVAAALPQRPAEDDGRADLLIARALMDFAPVVDEGVFQQHALGQEEREARAFLQQCKQPQLLAQLAVVTLFGLFQHVQIGLQFGGLGVCRTVHTAQAVPRSVAAPVGAGCAQQLYSLHRARAHQVRAGAQIRKIPLPVNRKLPALFGVFLQQLQLVGLPLEDLAALLHGDEPFFHRKVCLDDLLHLSLDGLELVRRKGLRAADVVIPAVVQRRADAELGIREQVLDGLRHNVRARVPEGVLAFRGIERQDLQLAVLFQRSAQVHGLAVHPGGAGAFVQAHADALCNVRWRNARLKFLHGAALQCHVDHFKILLLPAYTGKQKSPSRKTDTG